MQISTQPSCQISVLLITYNHEKYIHQALDTLFRQSINGTIELIIADDASSDSTIDIIKKYEGKDSRFHFKYLDNTINLGVTKNYQRGFAACSGEYVAVLEGDDYWISPFKLQRQKDFLNTHWECDLCSVNYFVFEENRFHFYPRTPIGHGHRLISARDLIADNLVGNFSTCMYRKVALDTLPKNLFEIRSYDFIINIFLARGSLIGFLEEPMSVYRLHQNGVWTRIPYVEKLKTQLALISEYNALTNGVYHLEFELLSNAIDRMILFEKFSNMCPPTVRALVPRKLKQLIVKILQRGAA